MREVCVFTLMIVIALMTHSVLLCLLVGIVCIVVLKCLDRTISWVVVGMVTIIPVLAVWWYDYRLDALPASPSSTWIVEEQTRQGSYRLVADDDTQAVLLSQALLSPGDRIVSKAMLRPREYQPSWCWVWCATRQVDYNTNKTGFNYDAWLYMRGLDGTLRDDHPLVVGHTPMGWRSQLRDYLADRFATLWIDEKSALALGMLIGDRSLFLKEDYQTFIDGGLVHLVAVSGGNIALVVALVGGLLFFVPFRLRTGILIFVVLGYAYLVGMDSSVLRATVMAVLMLVALLPGRPLSVWRMLAYARIALLLFNPYYLFYDLGFLLSFGAVLGILWADMILHRLFQTGNDSPFLVFGSQRSFRQTRYSLFDKLQNIAGWMLRVMVLPSIGALVGVTPVLRLVLGKMNLASVVFNIIIAPLIPLVSWFLIILTMWTPSWLVVLTQMILDVIIVSASYSTQWGVWLVLDRPFAVLFGCVMVCYRCRWIWTQTRPIYPYK